MKKLIFQIVICFTTVAQLYAQGIIINKTDGTKVRFPAEQVASISIYDYGEGPQPTHTFTVNGVSFVMVSVEGGVFYMGSDANSIEKPVHQVSLSSYSIGETEVTQELWKAVMGSNPSDSQGLKLPVENVSWNDCQAFITKLNSITGKQFRLPTEAEWEFAARGGIKSQGYEYAGSNTIDDVAWYSSNSSSRTHEVASKQPNELGIYDMSGNVWEWCQDWYNSTYYSSSVINNPAGPDTGSERVIRGGCCYSGTATVTGRSSATPTTRIRNLTFTSSDNEAHTITYILGLRLAL